MGYFDSAKNRVLWTQELAGLRAKREKFLTEGIDPYSDRPEREPSGLESGDRVRISYAQLEQEEAMAVRTQKERSGTQHEMKREAEPVRSRAAEGLTPKKPEVPRQRGPAV